MANPGNYVYAGVLILSFGTAWAGQQGKPADPRPRTAALERVAPAKRTDAQLIELAQNYYSLGQLDDASKMAAQALASDADNVEAWLIQGDVWRERRRWQQALGAYNRAARAAPDRADIELRRGQVLTELGKTRDADAAFERYQALNVAASFKSKNK